MPGRHKPPREQLHVPGPGAYAVPRRCCTRDPIEAQYICLLQMTDHNTHLCAPVLRFDNGATDGPAYSLQGRLEHRSPGDGAPGPADYDALQTGMAGPAFSLTGRTKSIFDVGNTSFCMARTCSTPFRPVPRRRISLLTMVPSRCHRAFLWLQEVVDSPAPGQYALGDRIGRDGAAFSMGYKRQEKLQEDLREYWMPDASPDGPAFTMGGRPEGKGSPHMHRQGTNHTALPSANSYHAPPYVALFVCRHRRGRAARTGRVRD